MTSAILSLQISTRPTLNSERTYSYTRSHGRYAVRSATRDRWLPRVVSAVPQDRRLVNGIKRIRTVCWISFWSQLALSLTSCGLFVFTMFASKARPASSVFLLSGIAASLISTGLIRKILSDVRFVASAVNFQAAFLKWNGNGWLLRNSDVNLIGMAASIIALQGECGILVAKLLRTSTATTPYAVPPQSAPASIDVFAVQGCANVLMSHFVSLFFLTFALRILSKLTQMYIEGKKW